MRSASAKVLAASFFFLLARLQFAGDTKPSPLPAPISNNAVAISHDAAGVRIFSFMGIGPKKTWDAISTSAYEMDIATGKWTVKHPVPGVAGRLAAAAVALHGQVFLLGGYIVDSHGVETTVPDMNVFVPWENRYYRGRDIPVPVADAVVGLYLNRYIFLIGGWSGSGSRGDAVRNVQVYDTDKDVWMQATPIPGTPVFGHAGAILGDSIVYVDGVYQNHASSNSVYVASSDCWIGKISTSKKGAIAIAWTKLPEHPGSARYRIAAGAATNEKKAHRIYFSGGTDTPYDYNGIGYDGHPAEPSPLTFAFDLKTGAWETVGPNPPDPAASSPIMDTRALLVTQDALLIVGGMEKGQQVTTRVTVVKPPGKK